MLSNVNGVECFAIGFALAVQLVILIGVGWLIKTKLFQK